MPTSLAGPQTRVGSVELAAADEHGQPVEQPAGAGFEQVVAPRDRPAQRLLALRQVPRARRQQREVVLEPGEDLFGRQELDPRRGELDGQRHPVQPRGDPADRRRVGVGQLEVRVAPSGARATNSWTDFEPLQRCRGHGAQLGRQVQPLQLGEARRVGWRGQPGHRELLLAGDAQGGPAGDEDPQARRAARAARRSDRRRVDHLLEVVEDEQHLAVAQRLGDAVDHGPARLVGHADRARDRRRDELRVRGPAPAGRRRPRRGSRRRRPPRPGATGASCRCRPAR